MTTEINLKDYGLTPVMIQCMECMRWTSTYSDNTTFPGPPNLACEYCGSVKLNWRSTESVETWKLKVHKK